MNTMGSQKHRDKTLGGKVGATGDDVYHYIVVRNNCLEVRSRLWIALNAWTSWYEAVTAIGSSVKRMLNYRVWKSWSKWADVYKIQDAAPPDVAAVQHALLHWMQMEISKCWHTWSYSHRVSRATETARIFYRYQSELGALRKWTSKTKRAAPMARKLRYWVHYSVRRKLPGAFKQWRCYANNWTVARSSLVWGAAEWRTARLLESLELWRIVSEYMTERGGYEEKDELRAMEPRWEPESDDDF